MTQRRARKTNETKSIYPKAIQAMLKNAHAKRARTALAKRLSAKDITRKINESKTAKKLGVSYSHRQIAVTLGNLTRNHCSWA